MYGQILGILPDADRVVSIQIFLRQLQHLQADDIVNILPKQAVDKVEAVHEMMSTFLSRDEPGVDAASTEDLCKLVLKRADFFCQLLRGNDGYCRAEAAVAEYNRILAMTTPPSLTWLVVEFKWLLVQAHRKKLTDWVKDESRALCETADGAVSSSRLWTRSETGSSGKKSRSEYLEKYFG